jgi:hypothetical protein
MANPSLKAKIEAAKSALEEDQKNTPLNQERDGSSTPETVLKPTPDSEQTGPGTTEAPTNSELDAATLDSRITRLESKLAENQRDLYTLLGKIREVTRLQNDSPRNTGPENTEPKSNSSDGQNATRHQGRKIAITLAILAGIILGASFFFASDYIDQHLVHLRTEAMQFVDFISNIVR